MNNNYVDISTNTPRAPKISCPRCRSENVNIQAVANVRTTRRKGCAYWIFVGWWLEPLLWIFATIPKLIYEIFRKGKTKTKIVSVAVCQNCGYRWNVVPQKITQNQPVTQDSIQTNPQQRQAIQQESDTNQPQTSSKKKKVWMIIGICAAIFVGSAAISGIIDGITGKTKKQNESVQKESSSESSTVSSISETKQATVIDCDSMNVLASGYFKSFMYKGYDGNNEPFVTAGWKVPAGKYRVKVIKGKTNIQMSFYVAESGTEGPVSSSNNPQPLLIKPDETPVINIDDNEYFCLPEPDHITLTLIEE